MVDANALSVKFFGLVLPKVSSISLGNRRLQSLMIILNSLKCIKLSLSRCAMLEVQDFVSPCLDSGKTVGTYSLDLSVAFELLRQDVLSENIAGIIPIELVNIIMDILRDRSFQVQVGESRSERKKLKVGCIKGSILGPRLFTLYKRKI